MERLYKQKNSLELIQGKQESLNLLIEKINALFITTRKKYVTDKFGTKLTTTKYSLTDKTLSRMLNHKETVAIFGAKGFSKFLTFDIDVAGNLNKAESYSNQIIKELVNTFEVNSENILVNYSGNKGLHVHVFFKSLVSESNLRFVYNYILNKLKLDVVEVEFRPTHGQAIKLPLQQHLVTKNTCNILDFEDSYTMLNPYALLTKVPMDSEILEIKLDELKATQPEIVTRYKNKPVYIPNTIQLSDLNNKNMTISTNNIPNPIQQSDNGTFQDVQKVCEDVITKGHLVKLGTRHSTTMLLSVYFSGLGMTKENAIIEIQKIISNTYENARENIDIKTKKEFALAEVARLVTISYAQGYKYSRKNTRISLFESELKFLMSLPTKTIREIALVLLVHDKKFNADHKGKPFTLSYRQVNEILGTNKAFKDIHKAYEYLIEKKHLKILNKGVNTSNTCYKDTTKMKINFKAIEGEVEGRVLKINLDKLATENFKLDYFARLMFKEEELKTLYSKSTYYKNIVGLLSTLKNMFGVFSSKTYKKIHISLLELAQKSQEILANKKELIQTIIRNMFKLANKIYVPKPKLNWTFEDVDLIMSLNRR